MFSLINQTDIHTAYHWKANQTISVSAFGDYCKKSRIIEIYVPYTTLKLNEVTLQDGVN